MPSTANAPRINTNASAFVSGGRPSTKIIIRSLDGVEVTLDELKKGSSQRPIVAIPSASPIATNRRTTSIRIESEGAKRLRIDSLRKEQEKKKREEEEQERIRKEEVVVAKECLRREEEECLEAQRKEEEGDAHIMWEEEEQKQKDALEAGEAQLEADEADDIVETTSPVREPQCSEDGEVLDTDELPEPEPQLNGDSEKKAKEAIRIVTSIMPPASGLPRTNGRSGKKAKETFQMVPFSVPSLSELPRRRPVPLDLVSAKRDVSALPPSALLTARAIENLSEVKYPEGIQSPHVELNANSKGGRFRFVDLPL